MELLGDAPLELSQSSHEAIAGLIADLAARPPDDRSLVIAVLGPWGSGKTTLMHLVFGVARDSGVPSQHLIHFNAWRVRSAHLTQRFFHELGRGLGLATGARTANRLRRYAKAMSRAGELSERVLAAAERVVTVIALAGIGSVALVDSRSAQLTLLVASIVLYTLGPLLLGTAWSLRWTHRLLERRRTSEAAIASLKTKIDQRLRAAEKPLIVAIDDIDRLSPERARAIIQLAKDNARFSNLTYLLLMDRDLAVASLGYGDEAVGSELLEKIVDFSVTIEPSSPTSLGLK